MIRKSSQQYRERNYLKRFRSYSSSQTRANGVSLYALCKTGLYIKALHLYSKSSYGGLLLLVIIFERHIGQLLFSVFHLTMHSWWKIWLHGLSISVSVVVSKDWQQITHISAMSSNLTTWRWAIVGELWHGCWISIGSFSTLNITPLLQWSQSTYYNAQNRPETQYQCYRITKNYTE